MADRSLLSATGARAVFPLINDLMRSAVTEVEGNPQVCKIILDSDGKECSIRYEHGEHTSRIVEQEEQQPEELLWHTVKAKNTDALIRKLCRYYCNSGGDDDMLIQLEAFLNCAIPHLYGGCRKEDFVFASLQKLAGITKRDGDRSDFDNIMRRSFGATKDAYSKYIEAYTPWMNQNVQSALESISEYLSQMHRSYSQ